MNVVFFFIYVLHRHIYLVTEINHNLYVNYLVDVQHYLILRCLFYVACEKQWNPQDIKTKFGIQTLVRLQPFLHPYYLEMLTIFLNWTTHNLHDVDIEKIGNSVPNRLSPKFGKFSPKSEKCLSQIWKIAFRLHKPLICLKCFIFFCECSIVFMKKMHKICGFGPPKIIWAKFLGCN